MNNIHVEHVRQAKKGIHTWIAGQSSCTLIIPKPLAQEYGLDKPSHVVVEGKPEGILIKKLEI
jgi:NADPH-dependent ferric siderophore reductase